MNKETFLEELRGFLHVLEDQEQEDILEEYAQHIDMKQQKGLSEEEAIKDFGSVKDLAAEILEAYHVKPEYAPKEIVVRLPEWKKGRTEKKAWDGRFFTHMGSFLKEKWMLFCHGIQKCSRWFCGKCKAFAGWFMKPWRRRKAGMGDIGGEKTQEMQAEGGSAEEQAGMAQNAEREPENAGSNRRTAGIGNMGQGIGSLFRTAGQGIAALWRWLWRCCIWWICLFWNIGWILASLLFGTMAMAALAGFGALLILVFQGYPLIGVLLVSLGGILCFGALSGEAFSLRIKIIRGRTNAEPENDGCPGRRPEGMPAMNQGHYIFQSFMNRLHKMLIGVFCLGVLLCGLGAGTAFTEFSVLTYGEKQIVGKVDMRTENFDVEYIPGEERQYIRSWYYWDQPDILTDKNIPENTVRFRVTYNAGRVNPYASWDEEAGEIVLRSHMKAREDEIALMMQVKDLVLQNLREGKIVSLDLLDIEGVTVLVNPASVGDIRLVY